MQLQRVILYPLPSLQVGPTSVAEVEALSPAAADVCIKEWRRRVQAVLRKVVPAEFTLCSLCFRDAPFLRDKALSTWARKPAQRSSKSPLLLRRD